jgi:virginiamycin B lyase
MTGHRRTILSLAILVGITAATPPGTAQAAARVKTFTIPTRASSPFRIARGPDGNLWFTEWTGGKIGRITPRGTVTEFPVPGGQAAPTDITAGLDGAMWFTLGSTGTIARISMTGQITERRFGDTNTADYLTTGPDGKIWFTESAADTVWRLDPATGTFTDFPIDRTDTSLMDITAGPDGNVWFTEGDRIGRITVDGEVTHFGDGLLHAFGITGGPDGNVWFAEQFDGRVTEVTPEGVFTTYLTPRNTLSDIAVGPDGNLWVNEFSYGRLARITLDGQVRETRQIDPSVTAGVTAGPGRTLWFLGFFTDKVYAMRVP